MLLEAGADPDLIDKHGRTALMMLGGSWVVINGVRSRVTIISTHVAGRITLNPKPKTQLPLNLQVLGGKLWWYPKARAPNAMLHDFGFRVLKETCSVPFRSSCVEVPSHKYKQTHIQ